MQPKAELAILLLLGATLLTTALPFYAALTRAPDSLFFGEGVYLLSQASSDFPLDAAFVADLREQPWAQAVSPEAYAFISWHGRPVVVRGVEAAPFLRLEGLDVAPPTPPEFAMVGERLATDLGLREGDPLWIPGSLRPVLLEGRVDRILPAPGATADELLLDLPRARSLTGLFPGTFHMVRVLAADGQRLLDYLVTQDATLLVGDGEANLEVTGGQIQDDRLGALLLASPELAAALDRSFISSFAKYSENGLRVVVVGMEVLTLALFLLILTSAIGRYLLERRRTVGLIAALGGTFRNLLRREGVPVLGVGLLAGGGGLALGVGIGRLLEGIDTFRFLGHGLPYGLDPSLGLLLVGIYAAALLLAVLGGLAFLAAQRPRDLLREAPEPAGEDLEVSE